MLKRIEREKRASNHYGLNDKFLGNFIDNCVDCKGFDSLVGSDWCKKNNKNNISHHHYYYGCQKEIHSYFGIYYKCLSFEVFYSL